MPQGRPPKPEGQRRNKSAKKLAALPGDAVPAPALPKTYRVEVRSDRGVRMESVTFLAETRAWWKTWAQSPQSTQFTAVAWQQLAMLARVVDDFFRTPSVKLLAEIRLQQAAFGSTPRDLHVLGLKGPSAAEAPAPKPRDEVTAARRRRERLTAV
jgi:hypothetical protein